MLESFRAFVVSKSDKGFKMGIEWLNLSDLPSGDVLIQVAYSVVNYKDALVCNPDGKVARTYPLVPGMELTGRVVESTDTRFKSGEEVVARSFGNIAIGISRHGGYSEYARVPGDCIFPLPQKFGFKKALVISAGLPVALALRQLEKNGLTPRMGPVLVTGATGGIGSLAVSLLSRRGYTVVASTGKHAEYDYLKQLGASEVLSREEVSVASNRSLDPERWAGSVDTVGGATLAYLMRTTKKGGAIAVIGLAGGSAFHSTVLPLILRGINVLGIDMPSCPMEIAQQLWKQLTSDHELLRIVDPVGYEVTLEDVPKVTAAMLKGEMKGRTLVRL